MQAQYLAHQSSAFKRSEALESQASASAACGYLLTRASGILLSRWAFARRYLRWVPTRSQNLEGSKIKDRRRGCPRASSFSRWRVCWRVLRPAATPRKKHLWWLSPSQFRPSPLTPASTSNLVTGWALWPAPLARRDALMSEGQSC